MITKAILIPLRLAFWGLVLLGGTVFVIAPLLLWMMGSGAADAVRAWHRKRRTGAHVLPATLPDAKGN